MEIPSATYTWKLDLLSPPQLFSDNGCYYKSPVVSMVGFKWYLKFYPNYQFNDEAQGFIYLCKLPNECSQVIVNYDASFPELAVSTSISDKSFENNDDGWGMGKFSANMVADRTKLTVSVTVGLMAVLGENGKDITKQYTNVADAEQKMQAEPKTDSNITDQLQVHEVRVQSMATQIEHLTAKVASIKEFVKDISLRINEEQKSDGNGLQKQIDEINQEITNILSNIYNNNNGNNDNGMDKDKQEFKNWVYNILGLPEFYQLFVEHGIETLKVVQMCTMNELTDIGISKIGHRMQILHAINELIQKSEI